MKCPVGHELRTFGSGHAACETCRLEWRMPLSGHLYDATILRPRRALLYGWDLFWRWEPVRQEFVYDGQGHYPHWVKNTTHGCDGSCQRKDFPGRRPRVGDIAICGAGYIGLLVRSDKQVVQYPDGNEAAAYVGIHLRPKMAGAQWSSRNPCIVGDVVDFVASRKSLAEYVEDRKVLCWPYRGVE